MSVCFARWAVGPAAGQAETFAERVRCPPKLAVVGLGSANPLRLAQPRTGTRSSVDVGLPHPSTQSSANLTLSFSPACPANSLLLDPGPSMSSHTKPIVRAANPSWYLLDAGATVILPNHHRLHQTRSNSTVTRRSGPAFAVSGFPPAATKDLNEPCFCPAWPPSEPDAVRRASCQRPRPGPPPRSDPIRHDPRKCPLHPAINITTTRRCLIHHIESPPRIESFEKIFVPPRRQALPFAPKTSNQRPQ